MPEAAATTDGAATVLLLVAVATLVGWYFTRIGTRLELAWLLAAVTAACGVLLVVPLAVLR